MKKVFLSVVAGVVFGLSAPVGAGPLDPPAGPVSSTYKTLDEVEARTAIGGEGTIVISSPGSYYLTSNVTTTFRGIQIQTTGVTLDLNGFSVVGDNAGSTGDIGVLVSAAGDGGTVVITGGMIRDFAGDGISTTDVEVNLVIRDVHIADCRIGINVAGSAEISGCSARDCTVDGFEVSGVVTMDSCRALNNGSDGFDLGSGAVRDCVASENAADGFDVSSEITLENCVARTNGSNGFEVGSASLIESCVALNNGGHGFSTLGTCVVSGSSARGNQGSGFIIGSANSVTGCTAGGNREDGFTLGVDCRISDSNADGSNLTGFAGIRGANDVTIDSCTVTDNATGIIAGSGSLVMRCAAAGNTTNYDMTGAVYGSIVTSAGSFATSNAFANIGY